VAALPLTVLAHGVFTLAAALALAELLPCSDTQRSTSCERPGITTGTIARAIGVWS